MRERGSCSDENAASTMPIPHPDVNVNVDIDIDIDMPTRRSRF
jgi:hypothetical protein